MYELEEINRDRSPFHLNEIENLCSHIFLLHYERAECIRSKKKKEKRDISTSIERINYYWNELKRSRGSRGHPFQPPYVTPSPLPHERREGVNPWLFARIVEFIATLTRPLSPASFRANYWPKWTRFKYIYIYIYTRSTGNRKSCVGPDVVSRIDAANNGYV